MPSHGITPACAGNTHDVTSLQIITWDHPRLRGEYVLGVTARNKTGGSPPLARGIRGSEKTHSAFLGITPACAGNTAAWSSVKSATRDHPRLRGEYRDKFSLDNGDGGSPPLARGIPEPESPPGTEFRITPACAGNTISSEEDWWSGSPPLARGIPRVRIYTKFAPGITPACAGNTFFSVVSVTTCKDHPRLRGEYQKPPPSIQSYVGSPPLARGIHFNDRIV